MNTREKLSVRKRSAVVATVVLSVSIVLGGTYAWQSMNAEALNLAEGYGGHAGGRLHDDYEVAAPEDWVAGFTANKDVYVENYESAENGGRDIFVRVKLYEYMELGSGAFEKPYLADGMTVNPAYAGRNATPLVAGADRDYVSTWTPRIPGTGTDSDLFKARWDWTQGGYKTYMPTFNKDSHSEETDTKGAAIGPRSLDTGETANATKVGESNAYPEDAGMHDYFAGNGNYSAPEKYWNDVANSGAGAHEVTTSDETHTATLTESGSVITMAEWKTIHNSQPGDFWVLDDDGWCYWANPLKPETATGLLLDGITLNSTPEDMWHYALYVKAQMTTEEDWTSAADGRGFYADAGEEPSADAEILLSTITGSWPAAHISLDQNAAAVAIGDTLTLTASVEVEHTDDQAWSAYTWSIDPASSSFANGAFTPSATDAGQWFTIKATSDKDTSSYAECKVYVPASGQGTLTGANGDSYIYYVDSHDNTYQRVMEDGTLGPLVCPVTPGQPGETTDRTNVYTHTDGKHYLDKGDDRHYIGVGPDGLLGTEDDTELYLSGGIMNPAETEVAMTVNPSALEVMAGESISLSVSAIFEGAPVDVSGVTWSLEGGPYAADTKIIGSGGSVTLEADVDEESVYITVRLIYHGSSGIPATIKDIVVHAGTYTLQVATTRYIPAVKAGDTSDWIEIATYGYYSLIIRKDNVAGTVATATNDYAGSPQQAAINSWFAGTSTLAADAPLRSYATQNDALANLGAHDDLVNGFSKPILGTAGATGSDVAFGGSYAEFSEFCSRGHHITSDLYVGSGASAQANYNMLTVTHASIDCGRSTTTLASHHGTGLTSPGYAYSTYARGFAAGLFDLAAPYYTRPLLWVNGLTGAAMFENR